MERFKTKEKNTTMPWRSKQITCVSCIHCHPRRLNAGTLFLLMIALLVALPSGQAQTPPASHAFTLTIDPGHGGRTPGAVGKKAKEKDITLRIALKFGQLVEAEMPDVKVVYTRITDVFVPLDERAAIANRNKSDLFVSIHTNANEKQYVYGSETYVMGLSKSQENMNVVMKENQEILLEDDYQTRYGGFDPNSALSYIKFNILRDDNLMQSLEFASLVQEQFRTFAGREDRGVRQGPFWVLWATAMPSVLIETGFISNRTEEDYLVSEVGQNTYAQAIYNAFSHYRREVEQRRKEAAGQEVVTRQPVDSGQPTGRTQNETAIISKEVSTTSAATNDSAKALETKAVSKNLTDNPASHRIEFRVQVLSSTRRIPEGSPEFKGMRGFTEFVLDGRYKYMSAPVADYTEAQALRKELAARFPGAFIVPFRDQLRITLEEATGGR